MKRGGKKHALSGVRVVVGACGTSIKNFTTALRA